MILGHSNIHCPKLLRQQLWRLHLPQGVQCPGMDADHVLRGDGAHGDDLEDGDEEGKRQEPAQSLSRLGAGTTGDWE